MNGLEWESVDNSIWNPIMRAEVPTGWLVRFVEMNSDEGGCPTTIAHLAVTFVYDPEHLWEV